MATVDYRPQGLGFVVRLEAGSLQLCVEGRGVGDGDSQVSGDPELTRNVALMALALGFAANEMAYRRSRAAEKRASHRAAADAARKDLLGLADMVVRLGDRTVTAWCSGCFEKTSHQHVRGAERPFRTYLCCTCGTPTVNCGVPGCAHHATLTTRARVNMGYCAAHRHAIPGFEKIRSKIETLGDSKDFLSFEVRNAARITKITVGTLGTAAVVAPMAFFAAPAVGAALGSSMLGGSLTGAAATSHGLAMLGGGAVASGGLGMAGGAAVVTATGTALGGVLGATTVTAYAGADPSFGIEQMRSGTGSPVVFATGFLTEGQAGWKEWQRLVDTRYPDAPVYQVHWGAKELKHLTALVTSSTVKAAVHEIVAQGARRGSRSFGLPGIGWLLGLHGVATNPWTIAKVRAGMTGAALADLISRSVEGPYVLMGHSLGARVMVTAALALGTRSGPSRIEAMHLLGAAVGRDGDWRCLDQAVSGHVWNYWSENDGVLRWLYSLAEVGETAVGQAGFKSKFARIKDRNVTRHVSGHSAYISGVTLQGE
ncbi:DUF726 domain-containing protein [Kineosporia sp. R_H_3]|uniref:DUF726 domain-containing protein n=1 Tax=Kineosporia sp. R_H_3 TaxID=1961848 RepID=UPI00117A3ADC|nr:DUF726 domain-containing protein [Kineosporia sp. R_H_3]